MTTAMAEVVARRRLLGAAAASGRVRPCSRRAAAPRARVSPCRAPRHRKAPPSMCRPPTPPMTVVGAASGTVPPTPRRGTPAPDFLRMLSYRARRPALWRLRRLREPRRGAQTLCVRSGARPRRLGGAEYSHPPTTRTLSVAATCRSSRGARGSRGSGATLSATMSTASSASCGGGGCPMLSADSKGAFDADAITAKLQMRRLYACVAQCHTILDDSRR